ncbi:MAG: adenylosuccinate synthetase, partial [Thermomicrobiales bacterium]
RLNGVTEIALTKFDVLDGMRTVRICTGYNLDGREIASPPALINDYDRVEPVYEDLSGWSEETTAAEGIADLPPSARAYVHRIAELVGVDVRYVGVGPHRRQLLDSALAAD